MLDITVVVLLSSLDQQKSQTAHFITTMLTVLVVVCILMEEVAMLALQTQHFISTIVREEEL